MSVLSQKALRNFGLVCYWAWWTKSEKSGLLSSYDKTWANEWDIFLYQMVQVSPTTIYNLGSSSWNQFLGLSHHMKSHWMFYLSWTIRQDAPTKTEEHRSESPKLLELIQSFIMSSDPSPHCPASPLVLGWPGKLCEASSPNVIFCPGLKSDSPTLLQRNHVLLNDSHDFHSLKVDGKLVGLISCFLKFYSNIYNRCLSDGIRVMWDLDRCGWSNNSWALPRLLGSLSASATHVFDVSSVASSTQSPGGKAMEKSDGKQPWFTNFTSLV